MEDQGCQRKCKENISVFLYLWQTDMTNKRRMFCDWFANIALTHWQYKFISIMTTTREQCKLAGQSYILKFTRRSNDFNDSLTEKKACWSCSGHSTTEECSKLSLSVKWEQLPGCWWGALAALWFVWTAVPKCIVEPDILNSLESIYWFVVDIW